MLRWHHGDETYRYADVEDLGDFIALLDDPQVCEWLWFTPISASDADAYFRPVIEAQQERIAVDLTPQEVIVVTEDHDGRFLGHGAVVPVAGSPGGYEIGFQLARTAWRRGVGTRLSQFLVAYAVDRFDARRIEASCLAGNEGSAALLRNLGLRHEGTKVGLRVRCGIAHDELLFGSLVADLDVPHFTQVASTTGLSS